MRGYAEVRFVNQVLAKDKNANPDPACLLVDLGNGADLKVERNEQVLKERTGTPKFIARSISCGSLLPRGDDDEQMPPLVESILNQSKFMHTTEYQVLNNITWVLNLTSNLRIDFSTTQNQRFGLLLGHLLGLSKKGTHWSPHPPRIPPLLSHHAKTLSDPQ
ncbi:kinase domain protein [Rhizoctonia solani]|uniref:Kinase domain protein n=1 Tax=Rhizoctonia solani TaxID=456999 RepID=A0A8H8P258_9AGAM|nr:kinase domain protein [Rhizoctonia solani]QRW24346.1 kinase domain protein [Rhizoctonia solani]